MSCIQLKRENDQPPLVSVVAPVHNVWEYHPDCIDRGWRQALDDLELVLVDDASPDGSLPLLKDYALRDDRVRIVSNSHSLGQGPAKNTGAAFPRVSYLFFLDSDDRLASPDVLNHLVSTAVRVNLPVVIGSCDLLLPEGSLQPLDRAKINHLRADPSMERFSPASLKEFKAPFTKVNPSAMEIDKNQSPAPVVSSPPIVSH